MTVELTPAQEALIQEQLETGHYHSRSEVIAEALELLSDHTKLEQMKLERLRAEIQKGLDSGPPEPLDMDSIIAEAKERYKQRNAQ